MSGLPFLSPASAQCIWVLLLPKRLWSNNRPWMCRGTLSSNMLVQNQTAFSGPLVRTWAQIGHLCHVTLQMRSWTAQTNRRLTTDEQPLSQQNAGMLYTDKQLCLTGAEDWGLCHWLPGARFEEFLRCHWPGRLWAVARVPGFRPEKNEKAGMEQKLANHFVFRKLVCCRMVWDLKLDARAKNTPRSPQNHHP